MELQKKEAYEKLVKAESHVRNFAQHLNHVIEEERAGIAREIQDELGQQLAGIKIGLSTLKKLGYAGSNIEEKVNVMIREVDTTIQSLRKIATQLRPGILDTLGLVASIQWLAEEFEKKTNIKCHFEPNTLNHKFEKKLLTCFFRICQEALTNIAKHSGADSVIIRIQQAADELSLKISDNGKGISSEKLESPFSMGLLGMRERANIIGARLLIISQKELGTTIQLKVKVNSHEKDLYY
jgi:signal transduction histidine kinase